MRVGVNRQPSLPAGASQLALFPHPKSGAPRSSDYRTDRSLSRQFRELEQQTYRATGGYLGTVIRDGAVVLVPINVQRWPEI